VEANKTVIVLAGGDPVSFSGEVPAADFVIAADSGLEQASSLGLTVDLVVGDMDSVDPDLLNRAIAQGVEVETYPHAKDATDLELALSEAVKHGAERVVIFGGTGGRIDHFLANALLMASPAWADLDVNWLVGSSRVTAARSRVELTGKAGDLVTLLPVGEPAGGVTTDGLEYALNDDVLLASTTRGVSNVMQGDTATVALRSGVLIVIHTAL
jgi:thiamine pyrophosphokinase